jgi:hypothetical protein
VFDPELEFEFIFEFVVGVDTELDRFMFVALFELPQPEAAKPTAKVETNSSFFITIIFSLMARSNF